MSTSFYIRVRLNVRRRSYETVDSSHLGACCLRLQKVPRLRVIPSTQLPPHPSHICFMKPCVLRAHSSPMALMLVARLGSHGKNVFVSRSLPPADGIFPRMSGLLADNFTRSLSRRRLLPEIQNFMGKFLPILLRLSTTQARPQSLFEWRQLNQN